ncbi:MAG: 1-acyl-sn-glycerol-3-phosphate acyltransferase [Clostridia bacterium]|nr:1-acyl-sn-glycerol-3-phosphate acyltransferase [Clostridia bacterium]
MSFFNFIKIISYLPLRLVFPVKVIGKENFSREKAVICCNHYSAADVVVIASRLMWGECCCVGKEETFRNKFVGKLFTKCGAIAIKRGESDLAAFKKILKVLRDGKQLLIFPEGTRNKAETPNMLPFQDGAAMFAVKTDSPVIPLVYQRKLRPFRRNYLLVGEKLDLSRFKDLPSKDAREQGTAFLYEKMSEMKAELDKKYAKKQKK